MRLIIFLLFASWCFGPAGLAGCHLAPAKSSAELGDRRPAPRPPVARPPGKLQSVVLTIGGKPFLVTARAGLVASFHFSASADPEKMRRAFPRPRPSLALAIIAILAMALLCAAIAVHFFRRARKRPDSDRPASVFRDASGEASDI
jgi:hypothetical protein